MLFPPKISSFLIPTFTSPEFLANGFLFVCFLNNSVYPFIGQNIFDLTILKVNSFTDMENKLIVTKEIVGEGIDKSGV